ncbi:uncharacterized protein LOC131066147 [Cryptomeria japonica]|uniref:uncharacterized protein LOC131066147 n=1 Tax=Cryptomeria japonica TaxID=3369 RepID=UPI0025AD7116|nr:uncharacterized protein LOC131066147 [Cryptomeria japonica]XP_057856831.1 uncharacterized protein LOC131066147 [Cryptomeria japonica]XP_057856832.1 uncharacterized protein LOC131066147 [Cryptomeria japonica]
MDNHGAVHSSLPSISGTRKEKKKQVKDELDRHRQAEKKRRRLEKALATSAAICSEIRKKKQKEKEEQQRLDEEVAAIAEAVALHVLADEDSEEASEVVLHTNEKISLWQNPYVGLFPETMMAADGNIQFYLGRQKNDLLYQNTLKCCGDKSCRGFESREEILGSRATQWQLSDWKVPYYRPVDRGIRNTEWNGREFVVANGWSQLENICLVNQKRVACDEKERTAEVSADLAAAQAVAALPIAKEAQAEAKVVKMAAEAAISRILDKNYVVHKSDIPDKSKFQTRSGNEMDPSSTQLHEIELKAGRKHCRPES